jgi:hypothetical protein
MTRFSKYSLPVAAAASLAVVLSLAAPRAVHAISAALVNVTNTAASPAIGQGVDRLASQNVMLVSVETSPALASPLGRMSPDGTYSLSAFVVPSGQSLVITSIDVYPHSAGTFNFAIANGVSGNPREFGTLQGPYTMLFQYSSGVVFPAGESVQFVNYSTSPDVMAVTAHGYLTSN